MKSRENGSVENIIQMNKIIDGVLTVTYLFLLMAPVADAPLKKFIFGQEMQLLKKQLLK